MTKFRPTAALTRRRALQLGGGAAVTALAAGGLWELLPSSDTGADSEGDSDTSSPALIGAVSTGVSYVHVIAHADDGLYFHNPDLTLSLKAAAAGGANSVTVCLTGGESDGLNIYRSRMHKGDKYRSNRPAFVRARMNGLRAAHSQMVTGRWDAPWDIEAAELIPGFEVELNTLRDHPHVQLVWMELRESRSVDLANPTSLRGLWLGAAQALPTLVPAEGPVQSAYAYSRQDVIDSIVAVYRRWNPTVVRTLDPNPIHIPTPPKNFGGGAKLPAPQLQVPLYLDHQDHTYSAYFAHQALQTYWASAQRPRGCSVESFRGYVTANLPVNLGPTVLRGKQAALDVYGWSDNRHCGDPAGCGDLKVGPSGAHNSWSRSTRTTAPGATDWTARLSDGRLAAFAVLSGRAVQWVERAAGKGTWRGPVAVGPTDGDGLAGQISAVRRQDGAIALFGLRTSFDTGLQRQRREVVTCVQQSTAQGGTPTFGPWQSLGTPWNDAQKSLEMGFPAVVLDGSGALNLVVRDWTGSVSTRRQPAGGAWTDWASAPSPAGLADKGYVGVLDGLGLAVTQDGNLHVFAAAPKSLVQWSTQVPGGPLRPGAPTGLPGSCDAVTAVTLADGTVRLVYREPVSARVLIADQKPGQSAWTFTDTPDTAGGYGRVAALSRTGAAASGLVLAARDDSGQVAVATGAGAPTAWDHGGPFHVHSPSLIEDASGRPVVVTLGPDGRIAVSRAATAAVDTAMGAWQVVGDTEAQGSPMTSRSS
ncbi:PIG-L family deacetylase [Streptacidiphilus jiangxiensis]|uniref:GlcNAc-PI de-N-acetylase n=1 Tax=Streptacidiphilus jiangxiensis TaxID=235985 RepID=A0A1H7XRD7_STRJI|nr:PIG-L family deacetylase [Streptacidiphilus jiangxiensis]SEM36183.1 GlcNAc-PI de-N-acetylase [Streptacidiphilus jiangxiensis]